MIHPTPFKLNQKRFYPSKSFPSYRHIPGITPHPISDPQGHSYQTRITDDTILDQKNWKHNPTYLYALDLFNFAYWWECHEYLEELWKNLPESPEKTFLQAIIQSSAGLIKWFQNNKKGMTKLFSKSMDKINIVLERENNLILLGIHVIQMKQQMECFLNNNHDCKYIIDLNFN